MKVLVAKTESSSEEALEAMLEQWGYDPHITNNAQEVLDQLRKSESPELVLLDHNLPGLNGLEELKQLRRDSKPYPPYVIFFNDDGDPDKLVEGLEAGGDDYITHLNRQDELQARVHVGERMVRLYRQLCRAREKLERAVSHDSLTGILNRRGVLERLRQELARASRNRSSVGVGMCDLDHFKKVNDKYGHLIGDQVLAGIGQCIRDNLREYDCVGRYGGEEFLIVTPDVNEHSVVNVFSRLRRQVAQSEFSTDSGTISITASFGIVYSNKNDDAKQLIAAADRALYRAKHNGRNEVVKAEKPGSE